MTPVEFSPGAAKAATWTRADILRLLWSGWAASVSVVLLATVAVAGVPRARGIGFFPELRYAVVTPVCIAVAVGAAFLYRLLAPRPNQRAILAVVLFALAAAFLAGFALAGPPGLAAAGVPAVLVVAILSAVLVPKFVERPRRSMIGMIAIVLVGGPRSLWCSRCAHERTRSAAGA